MRERRLSGTSQKGQTGNFAAFLLPLVSKHDRPQGAPLSAILGPSPAESAAKRALAWLADEERREHQLRETLTRLALSIVRRPSPGGGSGPLDAGSRWAGNVGGLEFMLLVSRRSGPLLEAVGVRPGVGAIQLEGRMLKPGACVGAPRLLLSEVQTLVGPPQEISRLELALEGEHELRGRLFAGESGEAQVVLSLAATAAGAKAAAAAPGVGADLGGGSAWTCIPVPPSCGGEAATSGRTAGAGGPTGRLEAERAEEAEAETAANDETKPKEAEEEGAVKAAAAAARSIAAAGKANTAGTATGPVPGEAAREAAAGRAAVATAAGPPNDVAAKPAAAAGRSLCDGSTPSASGSPAVAAARGSTPRARTQTDEEKEEGSGEVRLFPARRLRDA